MITLATLPQASKQEVFDQVARHLLTQNARSFGNVSMEEGDMCMYRDGAGHRCAAGVLIADTEYSRAMEGTRFGALHEARFISEEMQDFIDGLQGLHDDSYPDEWPMKLIEFAAKRELNAQVVQEVLVARTA